MSLATVIAVVLLVGGLAFMLARGRARAQAAAATDKPHSRAHYHGWWAALAAVVPALALILVWNVGSAIVVERGIEARLPEAILAGPPETRAVAVELTRRLAAALPRIGVSSPTDLNGAALADLQPRFTAAGVALASDTQDWMIPVALEANRTAAWAARGGGVLAFALALAGAAFGIGQVAVRGRARQRVERVMRYTLFACSTVAILTTVGIVLSMLFQSLDFFARVSPLSFFFGTVWDPRFSAAGADSAGQFGLIPLLAGTLYIALIALLVAVPVGLMSAVYMAEYASRRVRSLVKPALELLAGIPTIVYGIFALVTLGPFLRDLSAALSGFAFIQAQSVFTAGLVMGIMLIPVVSSLSDDVITAVPKAMRDGSLGLGATRSETIRKVTLRAALPGIVGAVLLTASRAIGETMIVVLAAGVAANLTANPFEAMTTITVKIVNQLTGDLEFNSPQTLVAFALGLTLFALTLLMNIAALAIVRKYREQYE